MRFVVHALDKPDALARRLAVIEAHRARPAGQFILRFYANHRSTRGCG